MKRKMETAGLIGYRAGGYGRLLADPRTKAGLVVREVPASEMVGVASVSEELEVGDVALVRVVKVGKNRRIEAREGFTLDLFEGDCFLGAFGNRYATGQFEGYVPKGAVVECDMLSMGGVLGEVTSRHSGTPTPTRVEVVGVVVDGRGKKINTRTYGVAKGYSEVSRPVATGDAEVLLVVGSAMDSGKTTTAGTVARSLSRAGYRVAAAKVTGTAAGKDARFFAASGAHPALDFVGAGYPSTYMIPRSEVIGIYASLVEELAASGADYIVLEIADGIYQRETKMLLESEEVQGSVDHVFFAAGDALAVGFGARAVAEMGLPLRATSGAVAASDLGVRESEELSGLPCLSLDRILSGELEELLGLRDADRCSLPDQGKEAVLSASGGSLRIA
ncbi:DUF1611 domain-containing protein [Rubrobacter indicoceani]|uniref:DUF1611 domain-containing protein n=1 Tax=Rubrobacter indicoceani TaxID=2051957 RepID=UPI0013C4EBF4|nr:DUF1611 domain-containing protein [Rubrobacter indicoceani]